MSLLADDFEQQNVSKTDIEISSIAWGFTIGFGFWTLLKGARQTKKILDKRGWGGVVRSTYIWMIWLEFLVSTAFGVICWLYVAGFIEPSFAFYFCILTLWALQVQFLLQIIINRSAVIMVDQRNARRIKIGVATFITAINISVYCIWIPARLQISDRYIFINNIWDRCEKAIYLLVDALLNAQFLYLVRKKLIDPGLKKYKPLFKFNAWIVGLSLCMDVLIIAMMSLPNTFVYMQFHPVAYLVKLNIEMTMAHLIIKISTRGTQPQPGNRYADFELTSRSSRAGDFGFSFGGKQNKSTYAAEIGNGAADFGGKQTPFGDDRILQTKTTTVQMSDERGVGTDVESAEEKRGSETSSTRRLNQD